jgi:hypothetical protein
MRNVAVTEGDKVEAEIKFGYSVNTYGIGDLVKVINEVTDASIDALVAEYNDRYTLSDSLRKGGDQYPALREAARIEKAFSISLSPEILKDLPIHSKIYMAWRSCLVLLRNASWAWVMDLQVKVTGKHLHLFVP